MTLNKCLVIGLCLLTIELTAQENAAPSIHLASYFPSTDAILKMQKIKIVQSADAEYFEVNYFTNGYDGLQQTPSNAYGSHKILIFSLWHLNPNSGLYAHVDYFDLSTDTSDFDGEGIGYRTINPYNWTLNTWYNLVNRSWKSHDSLHIGMFINDLSTGSWLHSATLSIPDPGTYLNSYNDAFLENWDGRYAAYDGRFIRAAYFKDAWNINLTGEWEKNIYASFSANESLADQTRNGIYHNSFNAFFDPSEDAYYLQHGGNTTPSPAFNGGRTLELPLQANQGSAPVLTVGTLTEVSASNASGQTSISWTVDPSKSPQLSAKVEILDALNSVVASFIDTMPQRRTLVLNNSLAEGTYTARVIIRDIFSQLSSSMTSSFIVSGPLPLHLISFKGKENAGKVELLWVTDNEVNTSHFFIQRSLDGVNFINVGKVNAKGNIGATNTYSFTEPSGNLNRVFYRLSMIDQDNRNTFSDVISLSLTSAKGFTISPNPSNGVFQVEGKGLKQITIYDQTGVRVLSQVINVYKTTVDLSSYPKGTYMAGVMDIDGKMFNAKLVIR
jgi:hypothetical protein